MSCDWRSFWCDCFDIDQCYNPIFKSSSRDWMDYFCECACGGFSQSLCIITPNQSGCMRFSFLLELFFCLYFWLCIFFRTQVFCSSGKRSDSLLIVLEFSALW